MNNLSTPKISVGQNIVFKHLIPVAYCIVCSYFDSDRKMDSHTYIPLTSESPYLGLPRVAQLVKSDP